MFAFVAFLLSSILVNKAVFPKYFKVSVCSVDSILTGTNLAPVTGGVVGGSVGGVVGGLVVGGEVGGVVGGVTGGVTVVGAGSTGGWDLLHAVAMAMTRKIKSFL